MRQGTGTTTAVCRDHLGNYMGSSAFAVRGLTDPPSIEAVACREALSLVEDLGLQNVVIASNCSTVVKHINEASVGNYGGVVKEIRSWMFLFNSCTFKHEFRSSNTESHNLARHALSLDQGRHPWMAQPHDPNVIRVSISLDK